MNQAQEQANLRELNRRIRELMPVVTRALEDLPKPERFENGQLVAVGDEPFEVVLHKGNTVYVKNDAGKVSGVLVGLVHAL
jgi:hypothetical protein